MRLRLFGKILIALWLTLILMGQANWLLFEYLRGGTMADFTATRVSAPVLAVLGAEITERGVADANRILNALPVDIRQRTTIDPIGPGPDGSTTSRGLISQTVTAPGGQRFAISYRYPPEAPFSIPTPIWIGTIVASLLFSVALAHYLTRPINQLKRGFGRLAQGDFDVQLGRVIGQRGDEFSDLALDFDTMAGRLDQLVTARDRLLQDVSHELRSPLTRLQLAIALARQNPQRTSASLDRIEQEAQKLEAMVGELLALARAESGAEVPIDYFDPVALVEGVVADAEFEALSMGGSIIVTTPPLPEDCRPSVKGQAELFRRAVENVTRNALRFSPPGHEVKVAIELCQPQSTYRIIVTDDGPGVADEHLDTLFDPFVRIDASGTGLGLAIAKRAIMAHGGTISARNRDEGGFEVAIEIAALLANAPV